MENLYNGKYKSIPIKNRITNINDFYSKYPYFDLNEYKKYNLDLKGKSNTELMLHYHIHGKGEERQCTKKTIKIKSKKLVDISIKKYDYKMQLSDNLKNITSLSVIDDFYIDSDIYNIVNTTKSEKIYLVISNWGGYTPYGGGECWMIDTIYTMEKYGYKGIYIYFEDNNCNQFETIKVFVQNSITFIQFPFNKMQSLYEIINYIKPSVISHQGKYRTEILKLANNLNIPFVSGYCFWNDIFYFESGFNVNMLNNNKLKPCEYFKDIIKKTDYSYVCGEYMNDLIYKHHSIKIPVIHTISLLKKIDKDLEDKGNDKVNNNDLDDKGNNNDLEDKGNDLEDKGTDLITIINPKGNINQIITFIKLLLKKIDIKYTFCIINTQSFELSNEINKLKSIRKFIFHDKHINLHKIYKKSRLLIILSLVDETFCRVAYEGLCYKIPIISTKYGNLNYLLKDYASFIDIDDESSISIINSALNNKNIKDISIISNKIQSSYGKDFDNFAINTMNIISNHHIHKKITNIGIFAPWCDQGLGIQCREYYNILQELGYNVSVLSHLPYHSIENDRLQQDKSEWEYKNIYYIDSLRHNITFNDVANYVHKYSISKLIIIEGHNNIIFEITKWMKMFNVKVYCIPNIEIITCKELHKFSLFDKILTNNNFSYELLKEYYPSNTYLLSFRSLKFTSFNIKKSYKTFFCCGGLNSITRKNLISIIKAFNECNDAILYVYIQGNEKLPTDIFISANINVIYKFNNYKDIIKLYHKHDVFIHLGGHEGLGLGFYESLACGTPVLTMNCAPNNEIILNNVNGWLIDCYYEEMTDNTDGLVKTGKIEVKDIISKIQYIITCTCNILNVIDDYQKRFSYNTYITSLNNLL